MGPMERNHLRYLLYEDPEIKELVENDKNVAVFIGMIDYSFGLIHRTSE